MLCRQAGLVKGNGILFSLLAVFLFATAACPQSKDSQPDGMSLQNLYDAALRLQKEGDPGQAAQRYREFLAAALDHLANGQGQVGEYAKASALYGEALVLTPDSPTIQRDYAEAALQAGDLNHAESLARGLLKDNSNDLKDSAKAHQILGRVLHKMNQYQDARKELETAVELDPSFVNEYDLAVICLDLDDEKCAVQNFDRIEASVEDSPALHMQIGLAYGNSDFTPRAVAEFKKVIAADPRYPGAHYCVAAALLAAGEDEKTLREAEGELKAELTISPNEFLTYAALGKIEASYHRYTEAEQYLKRAISLNPKNPDAFLYLGQMYFNINRPAEAEPNLRKAIQLTTNISRNHYQIQKAHFLLGRILMQQHRQAEAHAEMQIAHAFTDNALNKDKSKLAGMLSDNDAGDGPPNASAPFSASPAVAPKSADPEAVRKQRALQQQLAPAIADSYNNLGAITASQEKYKDALRYFQQAAAWKPSLEGLDYNLGRAAFMASRFSEAIPPLTRYLRSHPRDSGLRAALAMSQFMTHHYSACIDALKGAEKNVLLIPQMQYIYAESLVKTGQIAPGYERLQLLETAHPEIPEVHRSLGEIFELRGDRQNAIREFNSALQLNATDAETHYDLGKAQLAMGNTAAAISELERAVRLAPDDARYHGELANAYDRAFRMADAEKEHRAYEQLQSAQAPAAKAAPAAGSELPGR